MLEIEDVNSTKIKFGINKRPYLYEFLRELKKHFQVIVFTASGKNYQQSIMEYIDPDHKLFDAAFNRESCIQTMEDLFLKDLRIFEGSRDIKKIVLVDNLAYSYSQ